MGIGGSLLLGVLAWQARVAVGQAWERNRKYSLAWQRARARGKPMLVVGGPYGSPLSGGLFGMKAHGCGDVCLDIDPRACQGCPTIVADVRDIPFPDSYFGAAFASHVLEHLPTVADALGAVAELQRVADEVFVASPQMANLYAWLIPSHHLWVRQDEAGIWIRDWPRS